MTVLYRIERGVRPMLGPWRPRAAEKGRGASAASPHRGGERERKREKEREGGREGGREGERERETQPERERRTCAGESMRP